MDCPRPSSRSVIHIGKEKRPRTNKVKIESVSDDDLKPIINVKLNGKIKIKIELKARVKHIIIIETKKCKTYILAFRASLV